MVRARRMKVLMVIGTLEHAGTPMHVYELVRHLDRSEFDVEVCCLEPARGLAGEIRGLGLPVHEIPLPILYHPLFVPRLAGLWRLIRRVRPDIVHTFLFVADVFGSCVARLAGAPFVISSRRMEATHDAPRRVRAYRWSNRWVDRIVAPSEAAREACLSAEGAGAAQVVTIHNGIDLRRVRSTTGDPELPAGDGPWIGAVGHLNPIKGHLTLVEAMARIRREHPARLMIAGEGPMRQELEERIAALDLRDVVHLLGARRDVPEILRRLDLFVLPSRSEGMSNALLEALAVGLPVVATRTGGNPEVLRDRIEGRLVPPGDPEAMAAACSELLADPSAMRALGTAGRTRVESCFTVQRMAERTGSLYRTLVRRATPATATSEAWTS